MQHFSDAPFRMREFLWNGAERESAYTVKTFDVPFIYRDAQIFLKRKMSIYETLNGDNFGFL